MQWIDPAESAQQTGGEGGVSWSAAAAVSDSKDITSGGHTASAEPREGVSATLNPSVLPLTDCQGCSLSEFPAALWRLSLCSPGHCWFNCRSWMFQNEFVEEKPPVEDIFKKPLPPIAKKEESSAPVRRSVACVAVWLVSGEKLN